MNAPSVFATTAQLWCHVDDIKAVRGLHPAAQLVPKQPAPHPSPTHSLEQSTVRPYSWSICSEVLSLPPLHMGAWNRVDLNPTSFRS